jgi:arylsulfatase A-like enzyme
MDEGIGKLLAALEQSGRAKDTFVIFLSDNGGDRLADNGPLFHGKYTLWEGGIRVPCLLRWPGVLAPGTVSSQPAIVMDLTAAMLAAAGAPDASLDAENILPILTGSTPTHERTFFWRLPRPDDHFGQKAVRRGKWKYIYDREMELLFDVENDPGERRNQANLHPDLVQGLRLALAEWESKLPAVR